MSGGRLTSIVALVLVGAAVALGVVLVFSRDDGRDGRASVAPQPAPTTPNDPIVATTTLRTPVLFGDTLDAQVDVVLDPSVIDPASVAVQWDSKPWVALSPPRQSVEEAGPAAHVRMTYRLRCLASICAPARETARVYFAPARVTYGASAGSDGQTVELRVPWRPLVVTTRIGDPAPSTSDGIAAPWRANLDDLPAASTYVPARLAAAGLVVLGVLLLAVAGVVLIRALPRREPEAEPEPEPEPEPEVSALEQALAWLEQSESGGDEERRRALELVADEVERVGDPALALEARALAWSSAVPQPQRTRELAAELRVRLAAVLELEAVSSNGSNGSNGRHPRGAHNGA